MTKNLKELSYFSGRFYTPYEGNFEHEGSRLPNEIGKSSGRMRSTPAGAAMERGRPI